MKILAIYGSPRKDGNTAMMMEAALSVFPQEAEIHKVYLADLNFDGCGACRKCKLMGECTVDDDMQNLYKEMLWSEVILFGTPTHFSDVSVDIKKMMERTWWMKGLLRNKLAGYVVSGRRYMESVQNTLHAFILRHRMIIGGSGALGFTFSEMGNLDHDPLAIRDAKEVGLRLLELHEIVNGNIKIY